MLLELINQILDLARIEKGRLQLSITRVDLANLIRECIAMVSPMAAQNNITLDVNTGENGYVMADYTRLKQVILNLLSNAIKYNRANGSVSLEARQQQNKVVQISVTDTGKGISEELQENIFQPFYRLNTAGNIEGTGIGLSISKKLLEMMDGRIYVSSKLNEGSRFCIELPGELDKAAINLEDNELVLSDRPPETSDTASFNILVAEDNPTNQTLIRHQLETLGYTADLAENGQQALQKILAKDYDLLLTDCNMPLLDGYELTESIRSKGYTMPVIAITADAFPETKNRCINAGMNDYIAKPVELATLKKAIETQLTETCEPS
jgi:CheY-like chemotaxis protein/anti-sigma regulatory factor (Ser/Thr protein kinase)